MNFTMVGQLLIYVQQPHYKPTTMLEIIFNLGICDLGKTLPFVQKRGKKHNCIKFSAPLYTKSS
jgi:hypothetical protein